MLRENDGFLLLLLLLDRVPLLVSMSKDRLKFMSDEGVQDVEEILLLEHSPFRHLGREVVLHLRPVTILRPESLDGDLLVISDFDRLELIPGHELLLSADDHADPFLVKLRDGRGVELKVNGISERAIEHIPGGTF